MPAATRTRLQTRAKKAAEAEARGPYDERVPEKHLQGQGKDADAEPVQHGDERIKRTIERERLQHDDDRDGPSNHQQPIEQAGRAR